nr:reverse transcriptase domain-containing protein [Tanacetum cinerariifolium]
MPSRRNMSINDVYEQEFEQRITARIDERLDQFVDQLADRMNDMMNPRRRGYRNGRRKEESMLVYDTDIKDVIEEEEGFVGKGGYGGKEDNIKDVVVMANDLCSSMIQTTLSVDFLKAVDSSPHELIWLQKRYFGRDDRGSRSSHYNEMEFDAWNTNVDATSTREE